MIVGLDVDAFDRGRSDVEGTFQATADQAPLGERLRASTGEAPFDVAMAGYQATRDEHVLPMYEMTFELAQVDHGGQRRRHVVTTW